MKQQFKITKSDFNEMKETQRKYAKKFPYQNGFIVSSGSTIQVLTHSKGTPQIAIEYLGDKLNIHAFSNSN